MKFHLPMGRRALEYTYCRALVEVIRHLHLNSISIEPGLVCMCMCVCVYVCGCACAQQFAGLKKFNFASTYVRSSKKICMSGVT